MKCVGHLAVCEYLVAPQSSWSNNIDTQKYEKCFYGLL